MARRSRFLCKVIIGLLLFASGLTGRVSAAARVSGVSTLQIWSPVSVARAGGDVRVLVRVPPEASGRVLEVSIDSDNFYRSSRIPLDGAGAATSHVLTWRSLPRGDYTVEAVLLGHTGARLRTTRTFRVF